MYVNLRLCQRMTRSRAIQVLDLPSNQRAFDKVTLKAAFRKKAKVMHPDAPQGTTEKFKELQEAVALLRDAGDEGAFDFKFDDGDGTSNWAHMKETMHNSSKETTFSAEPVHVKTQPSHAPHIAKHIAGLFAFCIILFYWPEVRTRFLPTAREQRAAINNKYKDEHEEAISRKMINDLEKEER